MLFFLILVSVILISEKNNSLCWFCVAESITPTVELNALCMKLGKKPMYKPVDPYSRMQSTYNYNMRGGAYPPRYVFVLFSIQVKIYLIFYIE